MKRIILCFGLASFLVMASCEKKVERTESTETTTTTTPEPAPAPDTVVVKHETAPDDGTKVKINSEGVELDSKKVDVEVKK